MIQPEVTSRTRGEPIIQFSVYADNKVGRLNDLIGILSRRDVHIVALCTQDTTDSTLIRFIVDDPETARESLQDSRYSFSENALIAVEINGAMQLRAVTAALLEAEINIHYIYSFISRPNNRSGLAIRLEDNELAEDVLASRRLRVLTQADISR